MGAALVRLRDSRAGRTAGGWWHAIAWRAGRIAAVVRQAWRRSLQLRMVAITLIASGVLVGVFASVVAVRASTILRDQAVANAEAQLKAGEVWAGSQLGVHNQAFDPELQSTLSSTVGYLVGGEASQATGRIWSLRAHNFENLTPVTAPQVDDLSRVLTAELETSVATRGPSWQIQTASLNGGETQKYLVYGAPVLTGFGQVELYYVVPLTTENQAANEIRTTVLITGAALVVLLVILTALVTRLVVTPVRVAARTAQRLSAGLLDQRMVVNGEDDLALLGASFNQMAANLQRQIVRLEEMSRLQRRFTSDVSHELRTPLTTVRMAADLIFAERDEFDPAVARSAELLQNELDRFENLLTDLLEISRFDAGFAMLDSEPTDLVPIVERVSERLAGLAERVGVELDLELPDVPVVAEVDPRRVERILRNLVGNAIEHSEGRPVRVRVRTDESAVSITVRDHGVGLKPGEEKLVFNRFWRADPSRARQTGGTGLGLSISLEDARLHGGWLEAWGAPGAGAQFRLTLPCQAGDRLTTAPLRLVPDDLTPRATDPALAVSELRRLTEESQS
ncbi:MtrAB system histidine kinase MtrB [Catenuloplanes japonicus]|uniref:MtrAB system histidine kinase MtrB n=1 Tax=Catenuloplanes japonicus TaxID=33876 RepID=UPI0038BD1B38